MGVTRYTYVETGGLSVNGTPVAPAGVTPTVLDRVDVTAGMSVAGTPMTGSPAVPAGVTPTRFTWLSLSAAPTLNGTPLGA